MTTRIAMADEYISGLCEQLGEDPSTIHRIVIDATAGDVIRLYIERYTGEGRLVLTLPHNDAMKISILE